MNSQGAKLRSAAAHDKLKERQWLNQVKMSRYHIWGSSPYDAYHSSLDMHVRVSGHVCGHATNHVNMSNECLSHAAVQDNVHRFGKRQPATTRPAVQHRQAYRRPSSSSHCSLIVSQVVVSLHVRATGRAGPSIKGCVCRGIWRRIRASPHRLSQKLPKASLPTTTNIVPFFPPPPLSLLRTNLSTQTDVAADCRRRSHRHSTALLWLVML